MLGSSSDVDVGLDIDVSGERAVDRAQSKLDDLTSTLAGLASSNIAVSEAADENAQSQAKLASSSAAASTGLGALQAELASTRVAQEALEDSSGDLSEALEKIPDRAGAAQQELLQGVTDELEENIDRLEDLELSEEQRRIFSDFDHNELRGFVEALSEVRSDAEEEVDLIEQALGGGSSGSNAIDSFVQRLEEGGLKATSDQIHDVEQAMMSISGRSEDEEMFNEIFGDGFSSDVPLDPTSERFQEVIDDQANLPIGSHILYELAEDPQNDINTFGDLVDMNPDQLAIEPNTNELYRQEIGTLGSPLGANDPEPIFPQDLITDLRENDIETIGELFRLNDDMLERKMDNMSSRLAESSYTANEFRQEILHTIAQSDRGFNDRYSGEGLGRRETQQMLEETQAFIASQTANENALANMESDPLEQIHQLQQQNENIARVLEESEDIDDFRTRMQSLRGEGDPSLRSLADSIQRGELGTFDAREMTEAMDVTRNARSVSNLMEQNMPNDITPFQREILSDVLGDMRKELPNASVGGNVPLSYEALEMELMQEMLGEERGTERFSELQNLLGRLQTGRLGNENTTLLENDKYRRDRFIPMLNRLLPDEFSGEQVRQIAQEIEARGEPITSFLGEDSKNNISTVVGAALSDPKGDVEFDKGDKSLDEIRKKVKQASLSPGQSLDDLDEDDQSALSTIERQSPIRDATEAIEEAFEASLEDLGTQAAPGMFGAMTGEDVSYSDLLPDEDVLEEEDESEQLIPGMDISRRRLENTENYLESVADTLDELEDIQQRKVLTRGLAGETLGGKSQERGVFGMLFQRSPQILGTADNIIDRFDRLDNVVGKMDTPERIKAMRKQLAGAERRFRQIAPLLDVTSFSLGPLNIRFTNFAQTLFRLTALFGPIIGGLLGIAGAAVTAAGAIGMFAGVGAVGLLEDMENSMAGVQDRQEAVSTLFENLRQMAFEAMFPLRTAELADGRSAVDLFVDSLRFGLKLLNRISHIFADIIEMPVVAESIEELSALLLGTGGESKLASALKEIVRRGLPAFVRILKEILPLLRSFTVNGARIAERFSKRVIPALADTAFAFGLAVAFGAGFIEVLFTILGIVARVTRYFTRLINVIPFVNVSARDLAYAFGILIGVMVVLSKTLVTIIAVIAKVIMSMGYLSANSAAIAAAVGTASTAIVHGFGLIQSAVILTASALFTLKTAVVIALGTAVALLADFVYWSQTGESALAGLLEKAERFTNIDLFGDAADNLREFYRGIARIQSRINNLRKTFKSMFFPGMTPSSMGRGLGTAQAESTRTTGGAAGLAGMASMLNISVQASRGDRELARMIRREMKKMLKQQHGV